MREIPLTQGQVALVSEIDYDFLNQWKWYAQWDFKGQCFYAVRNSKMINGKRTRIWMHRLILNAPNDIEVDHRNRNTLDNQRHNLRLDPEKRNQQNRGTQSINTSGYKGVSWHKEHKKWQVRITSQNKRYHLGYFDVKEDGVKRYNEEAIKLHGEFARLNII